MSGYQCVTCLDLTCRFFGHFERLLAYRDRSYHALKIKLFESQVKVIAILSIWRPLYHVVANMLLGEARRSLYLIGNHGDIIVIGWKNQGTFRCSAHFRAERACKAINQSLFSTNHIGLGATYGEECCCQSQQIDYSLHFFLIILKFV